MLLALGCTNKAGVGYGPRPDDGESVRAAPVSTPLLSEPLMRLPHRPAYLPGVASAKAVAAVESVRIDPPRPGGTSMEPVLAGFSDGTSDHLIAGWHHVSPGSQQDELALGAAISRDSGRTWSSRIYSRVPPLGVVHFDPFATADANSRTLWLGALARPLLSSNTSQGTMLITVPDNQALGDARVLDTQPEDKPAMTLWRQADQSELLIAASRNFKVSRDQGQSFSALAIGTADNSITGHFPAYFADGEMLSVAAQVSGANTLGSIRLIQRRKAQGSNSLGPVEPIRPLNAVNLSNLDSAVPGRFRLPPFGQLALAKDGTAYYVYHDVVSSDGNERNTDVLLIRSTDRGRTWSTPQVVNADGTSPRDQFMPALAVGSDGAVHVLYFDTRRSSQIDASDNVFLDLVYARSVDQGMSFAEQFLTEAPFNATTVAWRPFTQDPQYFVGDYLALHAGEFGVYAAYPEAVGDQIGLKLAKIGASFAIGPGISGAWYDPAQSGHGIFIEVLPENRFLAWWFTFDSSGKQSWFGGVGTYQGNKASISDVRIAQGGRWIPNFNATNLQRAPWGSLNFEFNNCSSGVVNFQSTDPSYGSGSMQLTRLTQLAGLNCQ